MQRYLAYLMMVLTALTGCSTTRVLEQPSSAIIASHVEAGDDVKVLTRTGHRYALKVVSVSEKGFVGTDETGKQWSVANEQIDQLEVQETSVAKTSGLTVGIIAAVVAVLFYVGIKALDDGLDDKSGGD
jgi:hypothetical protein